MVSQVISEPKLWAGKFKTPEDLEKAYGHSVQAIVEKSKLEKELDKYKVPENYSIPEGLSFHEKDVKEIQEIAKNAKLSQEQFELTAGEMHRRAMANMEYEQKFIENRISQIGEEKINIIKDYIEKYYPSSVKEVVLNKILKDDLAMSEVLKDRDQRMNSTVPGLNRGSGHVDMYDGQSELRKAAEAWHREPNNVHLRNKYISIARDTGHAKMEKR